MLHLFMGKQRIYAPVSDNVKETIVRLAKEKNRSEAYITEKLIEDGIKFNMLEAYTLNPAADPLNQFRH